MVTLSTIAEKTGRNLKKDAGKKAVLENNGNNGS
jgi:hypothetical protein